MGIGGSRENRATLATLLTGLILIAAGCSESPQARPEPPPCPDERLGCVAVRRGAPIEIGTLLSMGGPSAGLGEDARNGTRLAAHLLSPPGEIHGHAIRWVDKNDRCSFEGRDGARDLALDPDTVAVIGTTCTVAALGTSDTILSEQGIILISPSNTHPSLTDPRIHQPFYLRVSPNDRIHGAAVANFVFRQAGWRSASTIHDGSPDAFGLEKAFADAFTSLGGNIVRQEAVQPGDKDLGPLLTALAADGIDGLYLPVSAAGGALIARQARTISGLADTQLAGSEALLEPDFLGDAGESAEGIYVAVTDDSAMQERLRYEGEFLPAYEQTFGGEPGSAHAAYGFDAAALLFEAIRKTAIRAADGSLLIPRTGLRDALYVTRDFVGASGTLTCTENGDCRPRATIAIHRVQNGELSRTVFRQTLWLDSL